MGRLSVVTGFAFVSLFALSTAALAASDGQATRSKAGTRVQTACGKLPKTEVAQNGVSQGTANVAFVDVAGSTVAFSVGGNGNTCVLVDFSGQVFAPGAGRVMFVRAVLDNVTVSVDGDIQFQSESGTLSNAAAYNFIFPSVAPGPHSVKMQFHSNNAATTVFINDFNARIQHR
jgi:hypothetical protein